VYVEASKRADLQSRKFYEISIKIPKPGKHRNALVCCDIPVEKDYTIVRIFYSCPWYVFERFKVLLLRKT
jgi:hypothetical protein